MISGVMIKALNADAALTGALATYPTADGPRAAIFAGAIPDDASFPAVVVVEGSAQQWSTRAKPGAVLTVDVQVFDNKQYARKAVADIAWAIWAALNRAELEPWISDAGWECWGCLADPPVSTNDGLGFPGYTVRVNVRVMQR